MYVYVKRDVIDIENCEKEEEKNTKFIYIHGLPEKINEILYETKKKLNFPRKN